MLSVLPALCLQGVHGPHEAGGPSVALLHVDAGTRGVELVTRPVLLIEDKALLTLALRCLCGVVEGEVVASRTGAAAVELVALRNRENTLTHILYWTKQTNRETLEHIWKHSENISGFRKIRFPVS